MSDQLAAFRSVPEKHADPAGGNLPDPRRHDLDALRAIAMLLGIALHALMAYCGSPWIVMDGDMNAALAEAVNFIHAFRMQLFFLVSGFFTAMLASRKGAKGMLKNRAARILVPLLLCVLTLLPFIKVLSLLIVSDTASHPQMPIFQAIQQGDTGLVSKLVATGPPGCLEMPEKRMVMTPLAWAVLCESEPVVRQLLDLGANPNAVNRAGGNPMTIASMLGRVDLLKLLIDKGGDPFLATAAGKSPWISAHQAAGESATEIWLAKGVWPADITALERGRKDVIGYLTGLSREPLAAPVSQVVRAAPAEVAALPGFMREYFAWLSSDMLVAKIGGTEINLLQDNFFDHLWFLWYLWWLCIIYFGWSMFCNVENPRSGWNPGHLPAGLLVAFVLTCAAQAFMNLDYFPRTLLSRIGPDLSIGIVPKPHVFFYYAVFFFFGCWYYRLNDTACLLGRHWLITLPLASLVLFPSTFLLTGWLVPNTVVQALFTWCMVLGAIGLAHRIFRSGNGHFRYVADASYWLYLTHVPVVICCQWFFYYLRLPAMAKATLVLGISIPLLLGTYQLMVRHTVIGRILNGKNPARS